jgi:hypothetical protein
MSENLPQSHEDTKSPSLFPFVSLSLGAFVVSKLQFSDSL